MDLGVKLLSAVLIVLGCYLVFRVAYLLLAKRELEMSPFAELVEAEIKIFAEARSLEYYTRMALATADGRLPVVIYLKKESADRAEMLDIVQKLHREHENLEVRLI